VRRTTKAPTGSAFDAALRLLGQRAHSRRELGAKLARRGYQPADVEDALKRAAAAGYLDDARYAQALVARRSSRRGAAVIAAELRLKGVDRELADAALSDLGGAEQLATARRLAVRLAASEPDRRKLAAKLLRRGFPAHIALAAARVAD
jgi:regulatory protein